MFFKEATSTKVPSTSYTVESENKISVSAVFIL